MGERVAKEGGGFGGWTGGGGGEFGGRLLGLRG